MNFKMVLTRLLQWSVACRSVVGTQRNVKGESALVAILLSKLLYLHIFSLQSRPSNFVQHVLLFSCGFKSHTCLGYRRVNMWQRLLICSKHAAAGGTITHHTNMTVKMAATPTPSWSKTRFPPFKFLVGTTCNIASCR